MSMEILKDRIEINVPNSEALIEAQHHGIKDRTVGQYYMSERTSHVLDFLNQLRGTFYLDFCVSKSNIQLLLDKLVNNKLESCFKTNLTSQFSTIKTIDSQVQKIHLYPINPPTINDNGKYLKFDYSNIYHKCFFRLCLGDLTKIIIRRLDQTCFVIYLEENNTFEAKLASDEFSKWEEIDEISNGF
jgi:hypothetical protein